MREDRLGRRAVLQERMLPLIDATDAQAPDVEAALLSSESFAVLQVHAQQWLAGCQREQERIRRERDAVLRDQYPLSQRQAELRRERDLAGEPRRSGAGPDARAARRGRPGQRHDVDELPFVAELLDVAPEEARWRTAIETVLGASARMMLVPLDRLDELLRRDRRPAAARPADLRGRRARPARPRPGRPGAGRGQAGLQGLAVHRLGAGPRRRAVAQRAVRGGRRRPRGRPRLPGHPRRPDPQRPARRARSQRRPQHHRLLQRRRDRRGRRRAGRARGAARGDRRRGDRARPDARGCWSSSGRRTTPWPPPVSTTSTSTAASAASPSSSAGATEILDADDQLQALEAQIARPRGAGRVDAPGPLRRGAAAARPQRRPRRPRRRRGPGHRPARGDRGRRPGRADRRAGGRPRGRLRRRGGAGRPRRPRPVHRDLPAARRAAAGRGR